jgi:ribonucleotide monophosphatase NagD (HAD superfamily)
MKFLQRGIASAAKKIGFAFDIDGVLLRGKRVLPGATETLSMLQKE